MRNPITTISGVVVLALAVLHTFAVINKEEQIALTNLAGPLVELIFGLILMFKTDDKGGL